MKNLEMCYTYHISTLNCNSYYLTKELIWAYIVASSTVLYVSYFPLSEKSNVASWHRPHCLYFKYNEYIIGHKKFIFIFVTTANSTAANTH